MPFNQPAPELGNQYADDRVLRSYLARALPGEVLAAIVPELSELGALAGGELYRMQIADRLNEPRHMPWDAWGNRVDLVARAAGRVRGPGSTPRSVRPSQARRALESICRHPTCQRSLRVPESEGSD